MRTKAMKRTDLTKTWIIQIVSQIKLLYVAIYKTPEMLVAIMQRKNSFEFLKENNSYQSSAGVLPKS